ncbi:MAG: hypothetical protein K2L12_03930 [Clostridia bacterium]|nr:hypothetical protein [Clostridia bacterium]
MFYARVLPPLGVCIGFYDKKLRDEWIADQNKKDRERHDKLLEKLNVTERDCPWEVKAKAISAKEAMKIFGERDAWGKKKIWVHKVLSSLTDKW